MELNKIGLESYFVKEIRSGKNFLLTFASGRKNRDMAQLVARHVRDVEVGSSSLLIPTFLSTLSLL